MNKRNRVIFVITTFVIAFFSFQSNYLPKPINECSSNIVGAYTYTRAECSSLNLEWKLGKPYDSFVYKNSEEKGYCDASLCQGQFSQAKIDYKEKEISLVNKTSAISILVGVFLAFLGIRMKKEAIQEIGLYLFPFGVILYIIEFLRLFSTIDQ